MTRPSKRERTRTELLTAARELLASEDSGLPGLAGIAERAGVTRQTVYEHFGSRSGLLLALVDWIDETEGIADVVRPMRAASTGAEALDLFVTAIATMTPRIYAVAAALLRERHRDPDAAKAFEDRMTRRRRDLHRIFEQLDAEGSLAPGWSVTAAADWAWMITGIPAWEQLVIERGWSAADYERHAKAALRSTFLA